MHYCPCVFTAILCCHSETETNCFSHHIYSYELQIEEGEIHASINQRDGMVSFQSNPEKYNDPKMLKKLDEEVSFKSR